MQKHLKTIIYVGLFIVPFIPFFVSGSLFFPFITTKAFAWRIIVEVVFAAWAILALANAEYRPRRSWILYGFLIFVAVIGVADIFGVAPIKSFWSNAERMEGFISLVHLLAYYVVASSFFRQIDWRRWWNTSIAASLLMCGYCFLQLVHVFAIHQGDARVDGSLGNAAYLAVYLLFHIFIATFYLLKEKGRGFRWFYISAIVFNSIILYFTATRGAILGVLGGFLVVAILSIRNKEAPNMRRFGIIYLSGFALLVVLFFSLRSASFVQNSPVLSRFASISLTEWKSEGRSFVWPMALQGIKEKPILGWGQENFNYVFNEHYSPQMYNLEPWFDRAHNIFLDWAIAGGVIGLLSYLSLYALFLYYLWRPASAFSLGEKAALTGLLSAYFFHNLFVFDNLISYILFASMLAYVDCRAVPLRLAGKAVKDDDARNIALPVTAVLLVLVIYFVNVRSMVTNTTIISALMDMQSGNSLASMNEFRKAYGESRLGRPEVVEQIASNAPALLGSQSVSNDDKNSFFTFARNAVEGQAKDVPTDARYQMIAGSFLVSTGQFAAGEVYLRRGIELMPGKQAVYFELAISQIDRGDYAGALATLRTAYNLAPQYPEAQVAYLVGAIYAGDTATEEHLLGSISPDLFITDTQVLTALYNTHQVSTLVAVLKNVEQKFPQYTAQAESYIKQVETAAK